MAELSLVPNVSVIAVQTVVFLTNLVVVKKLFVEPYLTLKDRRDKLTTVSQSDAAALTLANEQAVIKIETAIQTAAREASKARELLRQEASVKRSTIIKQAEAEAAATISSVTKQIADDLNEQKSSVPGLVKQLTGEVYQVAIT